MYTMYAKIIYLINDVSIPYTWIVSKMIIKISVYNVYNTLYFYNFKFNFISFYFWIYINKLNIIFIKK